MKHTIDRKIQVLHVDDEPSFCDLTAEFLEMEYDQIEVLSEQSAAGGIERFHSESDIDCIVSDYDMPGTNGIEFLQTIREEDAEFPFILYTGKGSEEIASDAISAGVTDYLQKGSGTSQYTVLANRITNAVEQYRSKRASEQSQKRLSLFVEQSPFAVVEWDENFDFARINDKVEEILGYSEEELIGESWETIVPESDQDAVGDVVSELLEAQGGYHSINENVRADGERIICEWHNRVVTDEHGETVAIFSQFQDITDRRDRRQQLELRNRAINEAPVGITITDPAQEDNPIIFANDQFVEYAGYPREEIMNENHRILQTPETEEEPIAAMREAIDNEEPVTVELRNSRKDGTVWWNRVSIAPIHDDDGSVQHYVGFQEDVTDRKQNEARLGTVASRFEAIFDNPLTLIALLQPDGTLLEANQTSLDLIDASGDDVTGAKFWNAPWWNHSETLQEQLQDWITRAADGEYVRFEAKHPTSDGEMALIDGLIHPVRDDEGEITELVAIGRDITERKAHEQELEETNAILSTLIGTLPVGILAEDANRNVLAVNNRLLDLFGFTESPSDLIGADCEQLAEQVSELFRNSDEFVADINELVTEHTPVIDEELTLRDGRTFARSHEPIELPTGEGHLWVYRDVTARTEREAQLEALNETTQELMTATTREEIAEIGVTAARDILHLDANAIHLYDEQESALVPVAQTKGSRELVGDPPTFTQEDSIAWRVFESGEALALDDVHADPDIYNPESSVQSELYLPIGEYGILIDGSATSEAFSKEDLVLGELLAGNIATALEQLERTDQIRSREQDLQRQNEQLDEFASVVSHDLRNPLRVAEGRLELAQEECDSTHLDTVGRAHDRMRALIEDLLALAREGERVNETESVDVSALTKECWDTVATADATIRTEIDLRIRADRSRLKQLLENLYRNAIEHGGDDVTVTVGTVDDGFFVEDNGPGIPEDDRQDVFEAGYSTAADGTGFGLSIVKQIVEAHGWTITVTEGAAGGARFEITGLEFTD